MNAGNVVVKVAANVSDFTKNIDKAQRKMADFSQTITAWGKKASIASAAVTGVMGVMIKHSITAGDQFHKMSLRTGETAESLSAMAFAAERSGSNVQTLETGIIRLSKNMNDMKNGIGEARRSFDALGISVVDSHGGLRSATDVMMEAADALNRLESDTERAAIASEIFGRSAGPGLLPLLKAGSEGIRELTERAQELNGVISTEQAAVAAAAADALTDMKTAWAGVANTLLLKVGPALISAIDKVSSLLAAFKNMSDGSVKALLVVAGIVAATGPIMLGLGLILAHPIMAGATIAIAGISALITHFGLWAEVTAGVKVAFEGLRGVATIVFTAIKTHVLNMIIAFNTVGEVIRNLIDFEFSELPNTVSSGFSKMRDNTVQGAADIADAYRSMASNVKDAISDIATASEGISTPAGAAQRFTPSVPTVALNQQVMLEAAEQPEWDEALQSRTTAQLAAQHEQWLKLNQAVGDASPEIEEYLRAQEKVANQQADAIEIQREWQAEWGSTVEAAQGFGNYMGNIAAGIVTNWDSIGQFMKRWRDQMIAQLAAVAAKAVVVAAVLSFIPGFGAASGLSFGKQAFFGGLKGMFGLAEGGVVTSPTVAMVGEAGPEAVIPLSKLGRVGGGLKGMFGLAEGGVVTSPTVAMVGEAGPEAVIPLSKLGRVGGGPIEITVPVTIDGREVARSSARYMPDELRRHGVRP